MAAVQAQSLSQSPAQGQPDVTTSGTAKDDVATSPPSSDALVSVHVFGLEFRLGSLSYLPAVVGFSLSASLLAVINKYALVMFPYPALLTALQYFSSMSAVLVLGQLKFLQHDAITWETIRRFFPAAFVFYMSLFTNMHLLQAANVDTFIVFRSCTPILVAVADYFFRDQPWPSSAVFTSLFVIFAGAVGYVLLDKEFTVTAYTWAFAYLFTITLDMVYIKHVVHDVKLNTWGLVLYNNLLALALFPVFFLITGEVGEMDWSFLDVRQWNMDVVLPVAVSCVFGLAISFFAFACRKALSATAFTVVGVTNKFITVIVNTITWDKHASPGGILCLILTIIGGVMYQQATVAPKPQQVAKGASETKEAGQGTLEEKAKLLQQGSTNRDAGSTLESAELGRSAMKLGAMPLSDQVKGKNDAAVETNSTSASLNGEVAAGGAGGSATNPRAGETT